MTSEARSAHRVVDAPLEPPSSHGGIIDVLRQRYLLRLLVRRELSARYQGSRSSIRVTAAVDSEPTPCSTRRRVAALVRRRCDPAPAATSVFGLTGAA